MERKMEFNTIEEKKSQFLHLSCMRKEKEEAQASHRHGSVADKHGFLSSVCTHGVQTHTHVKDSNSSIWYVLFLTLFFPPRLSSCPGSIRTKNCLSQMH